ncbi:hypothetical protein PV646_42565 [Streptomyces sp. ID05-26A]|nr:hypothetical protein [Streptomyces sp. ID05-26A]
MQLDSRGRVSRIQGSSADDVMRVYSEVRRADGERPALTRSPWVSGSFYLVLFVVATAVLLVVGQLASIWVLPVVVVGGLLAVTVVGAFQLRQDDKVTERGFLHLMIAVLGRLPSLLRNRQPPP